MAPPENFLPLCIYQADIAHFSSRSLPNLLLLWPLLTLIRPNRPIPSTLAVLFSDSCRSIFLPIHPILNQPRTRRPRRQANATLIPLSSVHNSQNLECNQYATNTYRSRESRTYHNNPIQKTRHRSQRCRKSLFIRPPPTTRHSVPLRPLASPRIHAPRRKRPSPIVNRIEPATLQSCLDGSYGPVVFGLEHAEPVVLEGAGLDVAGHCVEEGED